MEQQELNEEQKKAKQEAMTRAIAFESLTHNEGFSYLKAYFDNKLKAFVNELFNKEDRPISDFEGERRELLGLKRMFGEIDFELNRLADERTHSKSTTE